MARLSMNGLDYECNPTEPGSIGEMQHFGGAGVGLDDSQSVQVAADEARFEVFDDLSRRIGVSSRLTVHVDGGDVPPDDIAALQGTQMRELRTKGDGACAVHACFGSASSISSSCEIACREPRQLLADVLPDVFQHIPEKCGRRSNRMRGISWQGCFRMPCVRL